MLYRREEEGASLLPARKRDDSLDWVTIGLDSSSTPPHSMRRRTSSPKRTARMKLTAVPLLDSRFTFHSVLERNWNMDWQTSMFSTSSAVTVLDGECEIQATVSSKPFAIRMWCDLLLELQCILELCLKYFFLSFLTLSLRSECVAPPTSQETTQIQRTA